MSEATWTWQIAKHMPALKGAQFSAPGNCHMEIWVSLAIPSYLKKKKKKLVIWTFTMKSPDFEMLATNPNFYTLFAPPLCDFRC